MTTFDRGAEHAAAQPQDDDTCATPGYVNDVRKIGVLRANGLGDLMFALPALDALKRTYPSAKLTLFGKGWHRDLFEGRPGPVDEVVVIPNGVLASDQAPEMDSTASDLFFNRMQKEQFDLAFQVHGGGRHSNPFVRALGARVTAGLRTPEAEPLDRWIPYVYFQREVLRYLEVVRLVGAETPRIEPCLAVTDADLAGANAVVPPNGRTLAVLHPGATSARRRWPAERFAAVGDALAAAGALVAVIGTTPEQPIVHEVIRAMRHPALDLCDRLSLQALTGLLARASVVVSNDSGPLHLAAAVGTATVGVYWCGNLLNGGPISQKWHRAAASWRMECPSCGVHCLMASCEHKASFVADVPLNDVLDPAMELLAGDR